MNNSIYEVTRDEYTGFISQIKPECKTVEVIGRGEPYTEIHTYSLDKSRHFAMRSISDEEGEKYFVYEMPHNDERCAAKPVVKYTLETKEEVQKFFEILGNLQKGGSK